MSPPPTDPPPYRSLSSKSSKKRPAAKEPSRKGGRRVAEEGTRKAAPRKSRRTTTRAASLRRIAFRAVAVVAAVIVLATAVPVLLLRWWPPPTTAFMWASRTLDPATGRACARVDYQWVPWREISIQLPRAVLIAEDQRFLQHRGFDTKAIRSALSHFAAGGKLRGASTVSQQVAKNLFLSPERSALRKGLEAWYTVWIEALWPKRRIAEVYVNIAQFGPCTFGAEAASRRFFGEPASRLGAAQAARLAAVLPAPGRMLVEDPGPFASARAAEILIVLQRDPGGPAFLRGL